MWWRDFGLASRPEDREGGPRLGRPGSEGCHAEARQGGGGPHEDVGELAQLGERLVCNQEVTGSSPVFSTTIRQARFEIRSAEARQGEGGPRVVVRQHERRTRSLTTEYPARGSSDYST